MSRGGERTVLAGAGLVGSLLALFLARRGKAVEVFERRPDMRREQISAGRSINLAISVRGLHALAQVGLEQEALAHAIPMPGRMIHGRDGRRTFQAYGTDDSQCIHSISRGLLNRMLLDTAERTGRVRLSFRRRVLGFDSERRELTVEVDGAHTERIEGAVVYGTDGAGSAVRRAVVEARGGTSSEMPLAHGYKELALPSASDGGWRLERNALHIWPRGDFMLIALPNEDGSFTCTLFLAFEGAPSFATLEAPGAVREFFREHFADVETMLPDLEAQFSANPTGTMVTVKCSAWYAGDGALLLGDAAHAIVPFFGQGMNCGFEDCVVLDGLEAEGAARAEVFARFERLRKPNADAIADMAVENFVEMRASTADPRFLLEKAIEKRLLAELPGEFVSRYALVTFSRVPYRVAYDAGRIASGIVTELAEGVDSAANVDLGRARGLVAARLTPFLRERL
jgi:2-polyprenyl-6-methoxyphenol hydroxylase and related FAD-dependent oxidoreductases